MRKRTVVAFAGLLLAAAACQPEYGPAQELAEDVGCTQVADDDQPGARSAVECVYGPDEETLSITTFDDEEAFEQNLTRRATMVQFTVHGDDWAVTGPEPVIEEVHDDIGGSLLAE